ncbi:hypothetical protein D3C81_1419710 [compost metagenome]
MGSGNRQTAGIIIDKPQALLALIAGSVIVEAGLEGQVRPIAHYLGDPQIILLPHVFETRAVDAQAHPVRCLGSPPQIADARARVGTIAEGGGQQFTARSGARNGTLETTRLQCQPIELVAVQGHALE